MGKLHINIMKELYWKFILNSSQKGKVNQLIVKIEKLLMNCELQKSGIYWKDKSLYEVEFVQKLDSHIHSELIFEVIEKASKISNFWHMEFSSDFSAEEYDISGVSEKPNLIGLTWVSFMLQG
jgi:hypothetical protein